MQRITVQKWLHPHITFVALLAATIVAGLFNFSVFAADGCDYKQIRQRWNLPVPTGWVLNEESSRILDSTMLYPQGANLQATTNIITMVITARSKTDEDLKGMSLDQFTKGTIRAVQSSNGGGPYTDTKSIPTGSGSSARVYDFKPGKAKETIELAYQSWVIIEDGQQCFIEIHLEAPTQVSHDAHYPAFKTLVANFRRKGR